jgi:hypothetical protein
VRITLREWFARPPFSRDVALLAARTRFAIVVFFFGIDI